MKKFLCLLTITLITAPAFSGELIIQKIEPKNKPQENIEISNTFKTTKVLKGDTIDTVINKMGKPNAISNNPDGSQIWVYEKVITSQTTGYNASLSSQMATGAAAFNAGIAQNGFGKNMYTGANLHTFAEPEQKSYTTETTKIQFDPQGIVEAFSSKQNKY